MEMNQEEEDNNNIVEEPVTKEEQFARLWVDTLKEHGRDYDNSKQEINDFFIKMLGSIKEKKER